MKSYAKLVNFELNRIAKIYGALIALTIVSQITGVIVISKGYVNNANEMMFQGGLSKEVFVEQYGQLSFLDITQTTWIQGPIILCIAALIFYSFLIWYRDWFGKNTFIYRLLMLPTMRLNIYFAKATTIFLMVLGLVSLQLLLLPVENILLKWIVPVELRVDLIFSEILETFNYLMILFPPSILNFLIHYLTGFLAIFILFAVILFERSYGLKGIVAGIIYVALTQVVLFLPLIITVIQDRTFLYPVEYLIVEVILGVIVFAGTVLLSRWLLNKKVTV